MKHVAFGWYPGGEEGDWYGLVVHLPELTTTSVGLSLVSVGAVVDTLAIVHLPLTLAPGLDYELRVEIGNRRPGDVADSLQSSVVVPDWLRANAADSLRISVRDVSRRNELE